MQTGAYAVASVRARPNPPFDSKRQTQASRRLRFVRVLLRHESTIERDVRFCLQILEAPAPGRLALAGIMGMPYAMSRIDPDESNQHVNARHETRALYAKRLALK